MSSAVSNLSHTTQNSSSSGGAASGVFVSKKARKRIEAARVRRELRLKDKRERRSARLDMPRPGCVKEKLACGSRTMTMLHWMNGRKIGEFRQDTEERLVREAVQEWLATR